jgi:hypothetical protein
MSWTESHSASFAIRHESEHVDAAQDVLADLEQFRDTMHGLFGGTPGEVTVVMHARPLALALAHPWLPLARRVAAPAARRYFAGWFTRGEIHVLAPPALERRASGSPGSLHALLLSPRHEYAHLVIGHHNPDLPPPFTFRTFRRYVGRAWLCEGAATWLAGQVRHMRAAIVRRLREGERPAFPPEAADAQLLGGTLFALLEREAGAAAAARLAVTRDDERDRVAIERAFGRPAAAVERDWRESLDALRAAGE